MNAAQQISRETMELVQALFQGGAGGAVIDPSTGLAFQKSITTSLGLTGINLAAPSQKLYPALSPLRNSIPRNMAKNGATSSQWKAITAINTAAVEASVAFGTRNSSIAYTLIDRAASYKTYGLDGDEQDESVWFGRNFEDVRAFGALSVLQALMVEEEKIILGGLSDTALLGTPATPTLTEATTDGGTWGGTVTVYVKVQALPLYGYLNSAAVQTNDLTVALGRHSAPSAEASIASIETDSSVTAVLGTGSSGGTPIGGAFAYAWFVGTTTGNGNLKLYSVTTAATAKFLTVNSTGVTLTASGVTDTSGTSVAFDGLFNQIWPAGSTLTNLLTDGNVTIHKVASGQPTNWATGAIVGQMTLSGGTGSALTSDNAGGIVEIDAVLKALWDQSRVGPTMCLVNSQEARNITRRVGGSTSLTYRVNLNDGDKNITGGVYVSGYLNKFTSSLTPGSPDVIPFTIHPYLPPGTMIFISERVPYPNSNVQNVLEMELQQEYADFEWARATRKYEHGVYANGVLKHSFPAGCAVLTGIKNA